MPEDETTFEDIPEVGGSGGSKRVMKNLESVVPLLVVLLLAVFLVSRTMPSSSLCKAPFLGQIFRCPVPKVALIGDPSSEMKTVLANLEGKQLIQPFDQWNLEDLSTPGMYKQLLVYDIVIVQQQDTAKPEMDTQQLDNIKQYLENAKKVIWVMNSGTKGKTVEVAGWSGLGSSMGINFEKATDNDKYDDADGYVNVAAVKFGDLEITPKRDAKLLLSISAPSREHCLFQRISQKEDFVVADVSTRPSIEVTKIGAPTANLLASLKVVYTQNKGLDTEEKKTPYRLTNAIVEKKVIPAGYMLYFAYDPAKYNNGILLEHAIQCMA